MYYITLGLLLIFGFQQITSHFYSYDKINNVRIKKYYSSDDVNDYSIANAHKHFPLLRNYNNTNTYLKNTTKYI
jgi:hypothetical protein